MSRADFYLIDKPRFREQPLLLACELAKRCHGTGKPTLVLCATAQQAEGFERVLEVVPADPAAREPLRERWKQYQARGLALNKHDM